MLELPSPNELAAERCRRSLRSFIAAAWPIVEPATQFVSNWHIDAITEHLEAASKGEIRRLVINIPPRHMKTLQVSVFWPAWIWLRSPERRFLFASYSQRLASTHSVICRRLISSRGLRQGLEPSEPKLSVLERVGYRGLVRCLYEEDAWSLCGDQNLKQRFENTRTGFRLATSVGGSVTGEGGDVIVLDDPHKPEEALSDVMRERVLDWYDSTWTTRLNDAKTGVQVIVMQRLHEGDLTGHVLERGEFSHLCLPAEYEPSHPFVWPEDPRTKEGEVLWEKWDEPWLKEKREELGSYGYAGQYQQRPSPQDGGIFKRGWWQRFEEEPEIEEVVESWDMAFKGSDGSDFVVGQVWGRDRANKYLLGMIRARLDFTDTVKAVEDLAAWSEERWPARGRLTLIEDAANGPAVINTLRDRLSSLVAVPPDGGKKPRAHAASPQVEAGNVYLPRREIPAPPGYGSTPTETLIEETAAFPNAAHDDQVDAMTQALLRLAQPSSMQLPRSGPARHSMMDKEL